MSRRGKGFDNAPAESFFEMLKTKLVRGRRFETQAEARSILFACLGTLYNARRRHSALGCLMPEEYETPRSTSGGTPKRER
jgi:putative transposase